MKKILYLIVLCALATACASRPSTQANQNRVLAVETFLADIAQNVAGQRQQVGSLIPIGVDPHAFEPTPQDIARISQSRLLIVNGGGVEPWLQNAIENSGGEHALVTASAGLTPRRASATEIAPDEETDPHFWLDPLSVVQYVINIRDGLIALDPAGKDEYTRNADAYILKLKALDEEIRGEVAQIPPQQRKLVTNHETFGYFADRYGFQIVGTVIPSVSSDASPSAQQMARLIDQIRASQVKAIFLEAGANAKLAEQIAGDTGVKVVTDLHTHSLTGPEGSAPTYIDMLREDTRLIVEALK